jgi:ABC-type phosphate/phosphonate transport system substrate-binding protein
MIANARMYAVSPQAAVSWRSLLGGLCELAGVDVVLVDHAQPAPIAALWERTDQAAVFMCGLPFSRAAPRPWVIAAPVPSPPEYRGEPCYWSDLVVREDSPFRSTRDTFGHRIAFTTPDSQSGYAAALSHFMACADRFPLFGEILAPQITPLGVLRAVLEGTADTAPIDSYALELLRKFQPDLTSRLRSVGRTSSTPIPLLVASSQTSEETVAALRAAFAQAHRQDAAREHMQQLLIERFVCPDGASYEALRRGFEVAKSFWAEHRLAALTHPAFAL